MGRFHKPFWGAAVCGPMRPRLAALALALASVLAGCAAPTAPPGGPGGSGADGGAPGTALAMRWGQPYDFRTWGYEPSIAVDGTGAIFITAHKVLDRPETWPSLGSIFFLSTDGGATWGQPAAPGGAPLLPLYQAFLGAEGDIAVDRRDWMYYLDTHLGDNHLHVWSDQGQTWQSSGEMKTAGVDDRPWLAGQQDGVLHYLGNNGLPVNGGRYWYYRSDDAGLTFGPPMVLPGNGWAHADAERDGLNVYLVQEYHESEANAPGPTRAIVSNDAGLSWSEPVEVHVREGYGRGYPVVSAANDDGLAWVVINDCGTPENCAVEGGAQQPNLLFLARTADAGATWEDWNLTLPDGVFADYPWVAAGPNGTVAVTFYGAQTPVGEDSEWFLYAAMARPGRDGVPDLRFERADPQVLYTGANLHALHDFFEAAIGPDETLHIAYMTSEDPSDPVHDWDERFLWYVNGRAAP